MFVLPIWSLKRNMLFLTGPCCLKWFSVCYATTQLCCQFENEYTLECNYFMDRYVTFQPPHHHGWALATHLVARIIWWPVSKLYFTFSVVLENLFTDTGQYIPHPERFVPGSWQSCVVVQMETLYMFKRKTDHSITWMDVILPQLLDYCWTITRMSIYTSILMWGYVCDGRLIYMWELSWLVSCTVLCRLVWHLLTHYSVTLVVTDCQGS